MSGYIECQRCEFVLLARSRDDPVPKRWDACPDCGETEFRFVKERSILL